jgi:hypothetical protein
MLIYIFKPSSPIYKIKLSQSSESISYLMIGVIALQCSLFLIIGTLNPLFLGFTTDENGIRFVPLAMSHHNQYDEGVAGHYFLCYRCHLLLVFFNEVWSVG